MNNNGKKSKKVLTLILSGAMLLLAFFIFLGYALRSMEPLTVQMLDELPLDSIDKVMIVAHPDDEALWGGAHLAADRYLVVCITNGRNDVRKEEFISAVEMFGSVPLILDYPDKEFNIRSRWIGYENEIRRDILTVLSYKNWSQVVTHNPDGEYGHIHHKKVNRFVTEELQYTDSPAGDVLWYFGQYRTAGEVRNEQDQMQKADGKLLAKKDEMLNQYVSQTKVIRKTFEHMIPYEMWQKGY